MILYHYTYERHLPSILKHGLIPADDMGIERGLVPAGASGNVIEAGKVVWLKSTPSRTYSPHDGATMPAATVCLSVRIASDDRKLKQYLP